MYNPDVARVPGTAQPNIATVPSIATRKEMPRPDVALVHGMNIPRLNNRVAGPLSAQGRGRSITLLPLPVDQMKEDIPLSAHSQGVPVTLVANQQGPQGNVRSGVPLSLAGQGRGITK